MQVSKVAVVATGALATAAAMGSTPAFAADSEGSAAVAPATVGVLDYDGKHRASDEAMRELAQHWLAVAPEQGRDAPWDFEPPQLLSVGSGSALSALSWQICGSSVVAGVGATVPIASPNTVLGDCTNGNIDIEGNGGDDAIISVLDSTALSLLPWQICGSSAVAGVGATVPVASPNTVHGDCTNGNIKVDTTEDESEPTYRDDSRHPWDREDSKHPYGYDHSRDRDRDHDGSWDRDDSKHPYGYDHSRDRDWDDDHSGDRDWDDDHSKFPFGPDHTWDRDHSWDGDGSWDGDDSGHPDPAGYDYYEPVDASADALSTEQAAPIEESAVAPRTEQDGDDTLQVASLASGSAASALSWQICGSSAVAGVGVTVPVASPNTAMGDCTNGNIDIHGNGGDDSFFSILDSTALSVAPWQICGSSVVAGVGATVPVASPNTAAGDCTNGNIKIDTTSH
jgi:hypothetical protein